MGMRSDEFYSRGAAAGINWQGGLEWAAFTSASAYTQSASDSDKRIMLTQVDGYVETSSDVELTVKDSTTRLWATKVDGNEQFAFTFKPPLMMSEKGNALNIDLTNVLSGTTVVTIFLNIRGWEEASHS